MADNRKIVIEIIGNEGKSGSKRPEFDNNNVSADNWKKMTDNEVDDEYLSEGQRGIVALTFNEVKQAASRTAGVAIERYLTLSENYIMSTALSNAETTINKVSGFGAAAVAGAKAGGPIGALIGAGAFIGNEYIQYQARMSKYYQQLNETNIQTEWGQVRAGLIDGGKGTEN